MEGLQLYIELTGIEPSVWRRIVVPAKYSFYQLHLAKQGAFGWDNYHLFQFSETGLMDNVCYGEMEKNSYEDFDCEIRNARRFRIRRFFADLQTQIVYVYDFGDKWLHRVVLEAVVVKML